MLASINEDRWHDWETVLESLLDEMPEDFAKAVPLFQDAFETGWMRGCDYGFRLMDEELTRKIRSRFLPLFLARWCTRPRPYPKEDPHKKPLIKYMRAQRDSLPESLRSYFEAYAPSFNSMFIGGWFKGMEWGGRAAEVMWEPRFKAISRE